MALLPDEPPILPELRAVDAEIAGDIEQRVVSAVQRQASDASAIVISDYMKGCVTACVMRAAVAAGNERRIPVLIDPKIPGP